LRLFEAAEAVYLPEKRTAEAEDEEAKAEDAEK